MRKLLVLIAAAAAVVGCGGNGSNPPSFPYTGTWVGTWNSEVMQQGGEATFVIAPNGEVTGSISNEFFEGDGEVEGTIDADGDVAGTVTYPDNEPLTIAGSVSFDEEGHLVGTLQQDLGEISADVSIDVERQ
jgi:hypothetical protein